MFEMSGREQSDGFSYEGPLPTTSGTDGK
jgi:hypothetical protein